MEGHVLATSRKPTSPRRVPEEEAATRDELVAAIEGLCVADWLRLRSYARFRMAGLPWSQRKGRTPEDLLREAISRTTTGDRRWRRSVPFFQFLRGAMRSISTTWRNEANPDVAVLFCDLPSSLGGANNDSPESVATAEPDAVRSAQARETLDAIRRHFAGDALVLLVMDGLEEGLEISEVAAVLEVDQKQVEAALKKLRRHARELFPDWRTP